MANSKASVLQLEYFLNRLNGEVCNTFVAGAGAGSMVNIHFGKMMRMGKVSKNEKLTDLQRNFEGELQVFIQEADWGIKKNKKIICNNHDNNEKDGLMLRGLSELVNKKIVATALLDTDLSFRLIFEADIELHLKCVKDIDPYFDNYTFFDQRQAIGVNGKCLIKIEQA